MTRSFTPALIDDDEKSNKSIKSNKSDNLKFKRSNSTLSIQTDKKNISQTPKSESKKGYEGLMNIIMKSGTTDSISSKFMNNVMNKLDETDDLVSNSSKANMIRDLKNELEKQNTAKNQALNILKKLKKGDD